eukprot:GHVO01020494.1.p1 GENE.GHVO01020494.1~~GHVO01020494.1.p1  ORF type:complete len:439 (-),score=112.92 GHVO01020494.1:125-1267(-)
MTDTASPEKIPIFSSDAIVDIPTVKVPIKLGRTQYLKLQHLRFPQQRHFSVTEWKKCADDLCVPKGSSVSQNDIPAITRGSRICLGLQTAFEANDHRDLRCLVRTFGTSADDWLNHLRAFLAMTSFKDELRTLYDSAVAGTREEGSFLPIHEVPRLLDDESWINDESEMFANRLVRCEAEEKLYETHRQLKNAKTGKSAPPAQNAQKSEKTGDGAFDALQDFLDCESDVRGVTEQSAGTPNMDALEIRLRKELEQLRYSMEDLDFNSSDNETDDESDSDDDGDCVISKEEEAKMRELMRQMDSELSRHAPPAPPQGSTPHGHIGRHISGDDTGTPGISRELEGRLKESMDFESPFAPGPASLLLRSAGKHKKNENPSRIP